MAEVFKNPRTHVPGRKFDFQVAPIQDNRIWDDIATLKDVAITTSQLSTSGAIAGDIPVWNDTVGAFYPQDYIGIPFGFGAETDLSAQLRVVAAVASGAVLALQGAPAQMGSLLILQGVSGAVLGFFDAGANATLPNIAIVGNATVSGAALLSGSVTVDGLASFQGAARVTETLTVNGITTPATGALLLVQKNGNTKFQVNPNGCVGILRAPTSPVYALDIQPSPSIRVAAHYDWQSTSGQMGIIIDKSDRTDNPSHGITWLVGGQPCWDIGQDVATDNTDGVSGKGSSDMVVCYDYTNHSPNDDGTYGPNLGADIFRFTAAQKSFDGRSTTIHLSGMGAGRNTENTFLKLQAAGGYSGQSISCSTSGQAQHLVLVQRNPKAFDAIINYASVWLSGCDFGGAGGKDFWFFDNANQRTRLFLQGTSGEIANVGLGTPSPLGYLHVSSSIASSYFGTPQTLFTAGYANALSNRRINLQQISSSGGVENYLFLHGALGSNAAVGAPSITSSFTAGYGLRVDDNHLYLLASPAGTNQTPTNALTIDAAGNMVAAGQVEIGGLLIADANLTAVGKIGAGTTAPKGLISAGSSAAGAFFDTPQIYFIGQWANDPTNRAILLETILNASTAHNYLMLNGMASGTVASPTLTSTSASSFGMESTDTSLSLITAAAGTGMTPIRGLLMDNAGNVTLAASGKITGNLTVSGSSNLQSAAFAGQIAGAGGMLGLGFATITPGVSGDYTLASTEYTAPIISLNTGAWTGAAGVIMPATAGGVVFFTNNTPFAATVKVTGGVDTGIAVATGKTAILRNNGVNIKRVTADT